MTNLPTNLLLGTLLFVGCKSAPEASPSPVPDTGTQPAGTPAAERAAPPGAAAAPARVYDEHVTQVEARVGERFEIALPANVTTPFRWTLDAASLSDIARLSGQSYTDSPPPECPGCVGYPGTAHFQIEATKTGEATLRLAFRRLGQTTGEAKREIALKLRVSP